MQTAENREGGLEAQAEGYGQRGQENSPSWSSSWPDAKPGLLRSRQEVEQWPPGLTQDTLKAQRQYVGWKQQGGFMHSKGPHSHSHRKKQAGAGMWPRLEALALKQRHWT